MKGEFTMYQSLEAELHDAFWHDLGPPAELPLLRGLLTRHPGPALEIGCGSGRLLFPLIQEGFPLEGLDNSPEMIRLAWEKARAENLAPILHQEELASHHPTSPYQALALPAFTLQLYPNPATALQDCHRLLAPSGGLYLTVFYPHAEDEGDFPEGERYLDHEIALPDGSEARIFTEHHLDREALTLTRIHDYEIHRSNGSHETHRSQQTIRYALAAEWQQLLETSGFAIAKVDYDFEHNEPPQEESAGITTFFAIKK
jgi:SAM-dependent methyltransferase